ncbi:hypothetical protein A3B42_03640 [Candidatus Daviesbacteria bacterium RIFCSPLOWO2_01_FULL_38_10]|uniref:Uncharacterized protein n=1 Tax=Candidatus Daviesbacteria bacterium GW2011_GWF2_38_6 TaxID=1618432 RepID=A0A0G0MXA4_9BACT|nr:MAG: hypothetical protein US99_C0026G0004 [Candidatus Daviesbacteria bacterium GW2011_GWF2_38_6]OGE26347.1 MAG: hypothetical protein A3D02_01600 [Candidatus Daviesbacteria bacterium RIFCSPHIGHO2_02_FULL_39_41]OGE39507.1 MAG: hypothetical protein A3B42_03640 [Candidatus Daviesbacteria bacterium RIFCSPLOWO2_01_FULL_38_10]OGE45088.1 MAG: hypothetical protein A3E67_04005 [Candidatus Daviesbacteria bacterium RIFCSPHIGHO2_12_FULL_38_25]OGE68577.1 MAG: hypothetical protein A3H81_01945 [Candidatus D
MQTVRTTIRIRKDLIDQSRLLAFQRDASLQDVINETLALGFGQISDLDIQQDAMARIDSFREGLKGKKFNTKRLVEENKKELVRRTDKLLRNF